MRRGDFVAVQRALAGGGSGGGAVAHVLAVEAACSGHRDLLELLLSQDPGCVSAVDPRLAGTPLHWASALGDWGAAQLLLTRGADVLVRARSGRRASGAGV